MNRTKTTRRQRFPRNRILDALGLPQCNPNSTLCVCGHRKKEHHIDTEAWPKLVILGCSGEDCDCDKFMGIEE